MKSKRASMEDLVKALTDTMSVTDIKKTAICIEVGRAARRIRRKILKIIQRMINYDK